MAPVIKNRKGTHEKVIDRIRREGFVRARIDGEIYNLNEEEISLEKTYKHVIEIVVDSVIIVKGRRIKADRGL